MNLNWLEATANALGFTTYRRPDQLAIFTKDEHWGVIAHDDGTVYGRTLNNQWGQYFEFTPDFYKLIDLATEYREGFKK